MAAGVLPKLRDNVHYHVFIAHSEEVNDKVKQKFGDSLREEGYQIFEKKAGTDEIGDAIRQSRCTVLVITKYYMETEEFKSVINEAINWSYKNAKRVLLPILDDVMEKDVPRQLRVMHTSFYHMEDENLLRRLKQGIADEVTLDTVMPAGNMAYGLAWSYFYGYLNHLLPGLKERAEESDFLLEKSKESKFLPKFVIFIPKDCYCPESLTEIDERFDTFKDHVKYEATRSGNERDYKSTVYSITDPTEGKYYLMCEFATPLLTLYDMARIKGPACLTEEHQRHQKELFVEVLREILEHPENAECNGKCIILEYNGSLVATEGNATGQDFADFVLKKIKEELKEKRKDHPLVDPRSLYTYKVPIGDVAYGLAHTYFFGYMKLVLPVLQERVKVSKIYQANSGMFCNKLLLVITPDGFCPKIFTDAEETFQKEDEIPIEKTRAGNIKRSFNIPLLSVTAGQKKYYCMCEIPPPLQRLYDMEQGHIAGLDEEHKRSQIELFQKKLKQLLDEDKDCRGKYAIIIYKYSLKTPAESRKDPLSQLVIDHIKSDLELAALLRQDSQTDEMESRCSEGEN